MVAALSAPCVIFSRPNSTFKKGHTDDFECFSPLTTYCAYISKAYLGYFELFFDFIPHRNVRSFRV